LNDLLQLLERFDVEFAIVGAYALAFHGFPRYTGDLGLLVAPDRENMVRLLEALTEFGAPIQDADDSWLEPGQTISFGQPPQRVDILNWLSGLRWSDVHPNLIDGELGGVPVRYISKADLITNKRASGRPQDLVDIANLERS